MFVCYFNEYVDASNLSAKILCYGTSALKYFQTSNISRTLVGNKIVDHPDVVGAAPAQTTFLFST